MTTREDCGAADSWRDVRDFSRDWRGVSPVTKGRQRFGKQGNDVGVRARTAYARRVLATIRSAAVIGIDAYDVSVGGDWAQGLPWFSGVGLAAGAGREGRG